MSDPYLGDIKMFGFDFAPRGYVQCNGQLLPINQNQALFSLLGTTYGGDGISTFAVPDLRGRVPVFSGNSNTNGSTDHPLGQRSGAVAVTLTTSSLPEHQHPMLASTAAATANSPSPGTNVLGQTNVDLYRTPDSNMTELHQATISSSGNAAHQNLQPHQVVNVCIAVFGAFPSRN